MKLLDVLVELTVPSWSHGNILTARVGAKANTFIVGHVKSLSIKH